MRTDKWAVLLVRGDTRRPRQLALPGVVARHGGKGAYVLSALLLALLVFGAIRGGRALHVVSLRSENRLLTEELNEMRETVSRINGEIGSLAERDRRNRMLAGLVAIDPEVFEVGIGGPGLDGPSESPLWQHNPGSSAVAFGINFDLATLKRKTDLLETSFTETEAAFEERRERMRSMPTMLPGFGPVSSGFSENRLHPVHGDFRPHDGLDQSGPIGEPFVATADGRVQSAEWRPGFGYTVEIDHGFGITTLYAHASRLLVSRGERVQRAQKLGEIGCTGVCTGPHIHYEVRVDGRPVNPLDYVLLPTGR